MLLLVLYIMIADHIDAEFIPGQLMEISNIRAFKQ